MYKASIDIYLIGFSDDEIRLLEGISPLPSFSHEFIYSKEPLADKISVAKAIFLKADADSAEENLAQVLSRKNEQSQVILLAPAKAFQDIGRMRDQLSDFWMSPMGAAELEFHFKRWQESIKRDTDLWQTSQFLDATIDSIPSLVWYKTRDGIHEKVNSSFCKTVNKTKEQVQGQRHAYIWDVEEDDPACIESENEVMSSKKTCVSEESVQAGDSKRLLTTYKSPLYDIDGSVMGTVGVGIDITQERAYEEDLIEKNSTLETIFTSLDCGVLTHSHDGSRILGVNQKALELLGYDSKEELAEKGFDMVAPSVIDEDVDRLRQEITKLTDVGDQVSVEYGVLHKDGQLLHILGNIKLIEKDGEKYYQRFLLDITSRKALEDEKARHSLDIIRALSGEYSIVCVFDIETGDGEMLRCSDEEEDFAHAIEGNVTLDRALDVFVNKKVLEEDQDALQEALTRKNIREELKLRKRFDKLYRTYGNGVLQYRQVTVVRAGSWEDQEEIIIGVRDVDQQIRDELEKKQLLEKTLGDANKANAAKSAFLLNMSHDIRTPMNAIVGFTNLAAEHIDQTDDVENYLEKIKVSSNHLLNLINDILDMSRIEQGKVTLEEDACDISDVLGHMHSMLNHEAEGKGLTFTVDSSQIEHSMVVCDRLKVNQVLFNLLGNSIKFTNAGGKIHAKIEELPSNHSNYGRYRIIVEDTGIGIPEEFLDQLFDPFERVSNQTNNGIQGSGLGMAIVKGLVDMMNGSIEVESELGKGTRFTVTLTFRIAKGESACEEDRKTPVSFDSGRASRYRILLVDDNTLNREIATSILSDTGFNVETAVNGQDAIDKLAEGGAGYFDLVLMDIQMPVMNGYEAAEAIRSLDDSALAEIPILAVTADAFEEDRIMALKHGMNGHIAKPIEIPKLFEIMDELLD